ncbi:MAG: hypothetical protein Q4G62_05905 [Pseudomonadota bacterium]|nr:hypothetical protein [Pseudomonadota bacterium]
MQSLLFESPGLPAEVVQLAEIPVPTPGADEVLLKVVAAPIQPADAMFIGARYRIPPVYPQPAGLEGVGIVHGVGKNVPESLIGTRVAFRAPGAWSDFTLASINRIYRVPAGISDVIASQFALNPLTAIALANVAQPAPGDRALLTAGKSVVAQIAARILVKRGVAVDLLARDGKGYRLSDFNNAKTVRDGASVQDVLGAGSDRTYCAILDAVGGRDVPTLIDSCSPGARLVSYGLLDASDFTMSISKVIFKRLKWTGFGLDGWLNTLDKASLRFAEAELWGILDEFPQLLASANVFMRQDYLAAFDQANSHPAGGKVIFVG